MGKMGFPSISSKLPGDVRQLLDRLREFASSGDLVSKSDLTDAGIAAFDTYGRLRPAPALITGSADTSRPPAPVHVTATGAMTTIVLQWDDPQYGNFSYAEIFRSGTALFADAVHVGVSTGTLYSDPVPQDAEFWYWVRFWSRADVDGPWHGTEGIHGQTAGDPGYIMDQITGDDPLVPFVTLAVETEINGVLCPPGVYMKNAYMAMLVAKRGQIGALAVDDAAIANLSAAKVTFGEMSGDRIAARTLKADAIGTGVLAASEDIFIGGNLRLSGQGWIESYALGGYNRAGDYARIDAGQIALYRYIPALGDSRLYSYLSRMETGIAANATPITIPGYWKSQPRIIVSPASLQFYNPAYAAQAQTINCGTGVISETASGSMVWQFTPTATLNLAAATATVAVNAGSGDISANTFTSPTYTTPANCTAITPSVQLKSVRGNGSSQYLYRSTRWRPEYYSGSTWVPGAWRVVDMGAQISSAVTDAVALTFPSAGTWQWRIYTESYDTNGTVFGAVAYSYNSQTLAGTMPNTNTDYYTDGSTVYPTITFPALGIGGEVYSAVYNWSAKVAMTTVSNSGVWLWFSGVDFGGASWGMRLTGGASTYSVTETGTINRSAYAQTIPSTLTRGAGQAANGIGIVCSLNSASVTVYTRTIIPNSATPTNNHYLTSYSYTLTTAQVLATGTLNWLAVGE